MVNTCKTNHEALDTTDARFDNDLYTLERKYIRYCPTCGKRLKNTTLSSDVTEMMQKALEILDIPYLDGSEATNKKYAKLCIEKFGYETVENILRVSVRPGSWWNGKVTSFKFIYNNGIKIMSDYRMRNSGGRVVYG